MDEQLKNEPKKRSWVMSMVRGGVTGMIVGVGLSGCLISNIRPLESLALDTATNTDMYAWSAIVMTSMICSLVTGAVVAVDQYR